MSGDEQQSTEPHTVNELASGDCFEILIETKDKRNGTLMGYVIKREGVWHGWVKRLGNGGLGSACIVSDFNEAVQSVVRNWEHIRRR